MPIVELNESANWITKHLPIGQLEQASEIAINTDVSLAANNRADHAAAGSLTIVGMSSEVHFFRLRDLSSHRPFSDSPVANIPNPSSASAELARLLWDIL